MKIEAIDLFCGIGGLTYGLQQNDIRVIAGIDNDKSCEYSYTKNNNTKFICDNIVNYNFNQLKNLYSKKSIKILVGCAPCQTFSTYTFKIKDRKNDIRWKMINYFLNAIKILKPDIISMENVRGIINTKIFTDFITQIKKNDYMVSYKVVNCADYGVPQSRKRLVLLASKIGDIDIPSQIYNKDGHIPIKDVIRHLPTIKHGEKCKEDSLHKSRELYEINIKRIKQSTPSGTWRDWDKKLLPECYKKESGKGYSSVYGRMNWNLVSPTITTQFTTYGSGRFGHPEQNRAISIREGALLQTFPYDYDFGKDIPIGIISRHIGNAVPPQLGKVIGKQITKHIKQYYGKI